VRVTGAGSPGPSCWCRGTVTAAAAAALQGAARHSAAHARQTSCALGSGVPPRLPAVTVPFCPLTLALQVAAQLHIHPQGL
jgi:hypothetical protein